MRTLSFDVSGMTCGGCTGSVRRALSKLDEITHAEVTLITPDCITARRPAR